MRIISLLTITLFLAGCSLEGNRSDLDSGIYQHAPLMESEPELRSPKTPSFRIQKSKSKGEPTPLRTDSLTNLPAMKELVPLSLPSKAKASGKKFKIKKGR